MKFNFTKRILWLIVGVFLAVFGHSIVSYILNSTTIQNYEAAYFVGLSLQVLDIFRLPQCFGVIIAARQIILISRLYKTNNA